LFLKAYDGTSTVFKADDTDIAYVQYEQIKKFLPMPTIIQRGTDYFISFPVVLTYLKNN